MLFACTIGHEVWFQHAINNLELARLLKKKFGHKVVTIRGDMITFPNSPIVVRFASAPGNSDAIYALRQIAAPSNSAQANQTAQELIYEAIQALEGSQLPPHATDGPIDTDDPDIRNAMKSGDTIPLYEDDICPDDTGKAV